MAMRIATEITTKQIAEQAQREDEGLTAYLYQHDPQSVWRNLREGEVPMSDILLDGSPTGTCVAGALLEAAVQWNNFYVLFMTYDRSYGETLHIYLLNDRFKLLDSATLFVFPGIPYSTGTFSDLTLIEPNRIHFRFFNITSVELLRRPGLRMPTFPGSRRPVFPVPFFSEVFYVNRSFGFFRHFIVREIRHPLTS